MKPTSKPSNKANYWQTKKKNYHIIQHPSFHTAACHIEQNKSIWNKGLLIFKTWLYCTNANIAECNVKMSVQQHEYKFVTVVIHSSPNSEYGLLNKHRMLKLEQRHQVHVLFGLNMQGLSSINDHKFHIFYDLCCHISYKNSKITL